MLFVYQIPRFGLALDITKHQREFRLSVYFGLTCQVSPNLPLGLGLLLRQHPWVKILQPTVS